MGTSAVVRFVPLILLVALVLSACGGGGGDKRLSKQEFLAKGNAICAKYDAKEKQIAQPQSVDDLAPALHKLLPLAQNQLDELEKLKPPKEDQQTWNDLLASARKENEFAKNQLIPAADKKQTAKLLQLVQQLQALDKGNNAKARSIGLTACART